MAYNNITRVEVIDEKGRSYVNWNEDNIVTIQMQDKDRTLKIFIDKKNGTNSNKRLSDEGTALK